MSGFTCCARAARFFAPSAKFCRRLATCLTAIILLAGTAHAVVFSFDYSGDSPGEGFNDPVLGESRRAALQFAGDIWGDLIRPSYVNEFILVRAVYDPVANLTSTTLATAGAAGFVENFGSSSPQYRADTYFPQALANHLYGSDSLPNVTDINISFNASVGVMGTLSNRSWYYGTDGVLPPDTPTTLYRDFVTVALHEIGHGLGFDASFRQDGSYGFYADRTSDPAEEISGSLTIYDSFITVGPSTPLVNLNQNGRAAALVGNNLFWNGANGSAGNAGSPPQLHAPAMYSGGSSTSHLDATVHSTELMNPFINGADHTPSAMERGMLRDMGWTISVAASDVTWTGTGPNNAASTAANWSPNLPFPGDNLVFGNSPQTNVNFGYEVESVGSLTFVSAAPSYILTMRGWSDLDVDGVGTVNNSGNLQTIVLEPGQDSNVAGASAAGARLAFNSSANSGNVTYEVRGGASIPGNIVVGLPMVYHRYSGAHAEFNDNAFAGSSTFNVEGASGNGAPGTAGSIDFRGDSDANLAQIRNKGGRIGGDFGGVSISGWGGRTNFHDNASANSGTFRNDGEAEYTGGTGGLTTFFDESTAGNATFINNGAGYSNGNGGATQFVGNSTAGNGNFTNNGGTTIFGRGGQTTFGDDATSGTATINNVGPGGLNAYSGRTLFFASSSADQATITNLASTGGPTTTDFYGNSTAASATITNTSGPNATVAGITTFHDSSSAGNGTFVNDSTLPGGSGQFNFKDSSTAGQGTFTNGPFGGYVTFNNTSTAGQANFLLRGTANTVLQFRDGSSAGTANIDIGRLTIGPTNEFNDVLFYQTSTAASSTITVRGDGGRVSFSGNYDVNGNPSSTAGNATIVALGSTRPGNIPGTIGGQVVVNSYSTAGNATITAQPSNVAGAPGGSIEFQNGGHAGNATLIANGGATAVNGGRIRFGSAAVGDSARLVVNAGASADFSLNAVHGGTSVGSIEGAGSFYLGASLLTVGNRNTNTTVSGTISDVGGYTAGTGGRLTKLGTGTLTLNGANTYTGLTTVDEGILIVNGSIAGGVVVKDGGILKGIGSMGNPTVEAGGIFAPGQSPGTITVGGLNLMSGSTLQYELGATRDRIVVTNNGSVILGGLLDLSILAGFNPVPGETYQLFEGLIGSIAGAFSAVNAPIFNGHTLDLVYSANQVTLHVIDAILPPGDYTKNGVVDAADYTVWRDSLGSIGAGLAADGNGSGTIDAGDYDIWKQHFGESSGSGAASNASVPEPSSLLLFAAIAACGVFCRGHRIC